MLDKIESIEKQVTDNSGFKAMEKYFFVPKVVKWLGDGLVFRTAIALAMKVGALYFLFHALWGSGDGSWIKFWGDIGDLPSKILPSAIISQVALLITIYAVVHLMMNRANKIQNLDSGDWTAIPILVIFIRLIGEMAAIGLFVLGMAGAFCLLIGGADAGNSGLDAISAVQNAGDIFEMYPQMIGEGLEEFAEMGGEGRLGWFIHGIKATVVGSVGVAFFYYMVAEILNLLVSMAQSLSKLANRQG